MIFSKKVGTIVISLSLLTASISAVAHSKDNNSTKIYEKSIEQEVKDVLTEQYSKYYKVNNVKVQFDCIHKDDKKIDAHVLATVTKTLKAKKVEELPYVKGMLKKVGVDNFSYESKAKTDETLVKVNNGKMNNSSIAKASKFIEKKFNDLNGYIGKEDDTSLILKVSADTSNDIIVEDSITIMAENIDTFIPVEDLLPKSSEEMEVSGSTDMQLEMDSVDEGYSPSLYTNYNRIAARDYANTYTSNATTCDVHGSSCPANVVQNRSKWNLAAYPYYDALCHNDCANYVSQSLNAGGIPKDNYWKYYRSEWANTVSLKTYMVNKSYW